jgi:tetratricopeptide (TPR) repeat protein
MNKGNYLQVISLSDDGIELDAKNHLFYFYKGYANANELLKKYDEAIEYYDKVIQMKPNYVDAYYRKGILKSKIEGLKIQPAVTEKMMITDEGLREKNHRKDAIVFQEQLRKLIAQLELNLDRYDSGRIDEDELWKSTMLSRGKIMEGSGRGFIFDKLKILVEEQERILLNINIEK